MTYPSVPRIHGNGFVQVDLDEHRRLHVWDHRLPRQAVDSAIHDHTFAFDSRVLKGTLVNVILEVERPPPRWRWRETGLPKRRTHNLYRVLRAEGTAETSLESMRTSVRFRPAETQVVSAGGDYHMPAGKFHISAHLGTTVTLIRKYPPVTELARVACRVGERPDNSWVRGEQEVPGWALALVEEYSDW